MEVEEISPLETDVFSYKRSLAEVLLELFGTPENSRAKTHLLLPDVLT
jgi:hypothetical protein